MKRLILIFLVLFLLAGCVKEPSPCVSHRDEDGNLLCDQCSQSVLIVVDFYNINDLHGKLADGENHPGVDELTTFLKNARSKDDYAIFLSTGDMWQGSSESNLTYGNIIVDWMNELDFAAMALGNHEYDWGEGYIEANAELADFPFLAINIFDRATNSRVDYCDASVVVDCGPIQVGIIGAMGDCYSSISSDKVQDVYFKTGKELTALVKQESERLRNQGVDMIVYTIHDGWNTTSSGNISDQELASYYDIELSNGYVDLVFEGHTHQKYLVQDRYGVLHMQNKGDNKGGISHVELTYNTLTGAVSPRAPGLLGKGNYEYLPDDPIVSELLDKYEDEISVSKEILGKNGQFRNSKWLRQKVADLYLEVGLEKWGGEYDIALGGGFISVRSPYELQQGNVTYGMLQSIFPFDNELVLCSIRGSDLLNKFINTNNSNYFISRSDNKTIDPNGVYYVVVDTYTSTYAPNRLTEIARYDAGIYARDLLAAYIAAGNME
jgi:2',3'-cyclic-nucleotide 2'-phosphodiesterase (5'-nucleotidase family)